MEQKNNLIKAKVFTLNDYGPLLTNITRNPTLLAVFGKDELLAKRLIYYILYMAYTRHIDKLIEMDITHFAETMNIAKNHLQERVGEPLHFKGLSEEERLKLTIDDRAYDTRFANAIYKLAHISFTGLTIISKQMTTNNEQITTVSDQLSPLISEIQLVIYPSQRKKKIIRITPSNLFLKHFSQSFTLVHHDTYIRLLGNRRKNIEDLYAFLVTTKNYMLTIKTNTYPLIFDELCDVCKISHYTEQAKKKQTLKGFLKVIKEQAPDLNMDFYWQKSGRFNYRPVLTISNPAQLSQQDKRDLRMNIFHGLTHYFFKRTFISHYAESVSAEELLSQFPIWMANTAIHRELKIAAYKEAWQISFNREFKTYHLPFAFYFIDHGTHKNEIVHHADRVPETTTEPLFPHTKP